MDSEQNNWAGAVKTTFSVSRGILWQFFTEKRMVFHIFLHFEQNHCLLLPNIYGRVSETSIYVSGGKNWEKKSKKDHFLVILYSELKKKLDFAQNNLARVVKTTFGMSRWILWQFFIEKRMVFHIFLYFEQNHCLLLPNNYGRFSETSIYVCGGKNWEKKNEEKMISW